MMQGMSTSKRPVAVGWVAAAALTGTLLLGAAPAQAGGGFERGFENELGRIAAREVVRIGKLVLTGGHGFYYDARWTAAYPAPGYEAYPARPRHRRTAPPRGWHPVATAPPQSQPPPSYAPPPRYAPPPQHSEPCNHAPAAEPYQERIVYERYERVINRAPSPEPYGTYGRETRY